MAVFLRNSDDLRDIDTSIHWYAVTGTEVDLAIELRFPELDALLESLQKISQELTSSKDEMDKKQNSNLIDLTNSFLEETTTLYQLLKDDNQSESIDDQKLNDIATELRLELDALLVKYETDQNTKGVSFIKNYKTVLDNLLLKFKKKN